MGERSVPTPEAWRPYWAHIQNLEYVISRRSNTIPKPNIGQPLSFGHTIVTLKETQLESQWIIDLTNFHLWKWTFEFKFEMDPIKQVVLLKADHNPPHGPHPPHDDSRYLPRAVISSLVWYSGRTSSLQLSNTHLTSSPSSHRWSFNLAGYCSSFPLEALQCHPPTIPSQV